MLFFSYAQKICSSLSTYMSDWSDVTQLISVIFEFFYAHTMLQKYINDLMSAFLTEKHPLKFYHNFSHYSNLKIFADNEIIFREGDKATSFFLLCKGEVSKVKQRAVAQYQLLETFNTMEILGLAPVLSDSSYATSAIVKSRAYTFKVLKEELIILKESLIVY